MKFVKSSHDGWHGVMLISYRDIDLWDAAMVASWCRQTFGIPNLRESTDIDRVRWRDQLYEGVLYFRDEQDQLMFLLKWGS